MPIIQRLVREYNQAKVALSDASAQGLPAHEYQALKVDVRGRAPETRDM